jgi:hypothetical protein
MKDLLIQFVVTLLAAFAGSYFSYMFQRWQVTREERERIYSTLLRTQAYFVSSLNFLKDFEKQNLTDFLRVQKKELRGEQVFATLLSERYSVVDYSQLILCFEKKELQLYFEIESADVSFKTFFEVLRQRNKVYNECCLHPESIYLSLDAEHVVPTPKKQMLDSLTYQVPEAYEFCLKKNKEIRDKMVQFIKVKYPTKWALKVADDSDDRKR